MGKEKAHGEVNQAVRGPWQSLENLRGQSRLSTLYEKNNPNTKSLTLTMAIFTISWYFRPEARRDETFLSQPNSRRLGECKSPQNGLLL